MGSIYGVDEALVRSAEAEFRSPHYLRLNARRLEHLASLGLPLNDRSVIEVGAGVGDHTPFFLDRGCEVVAIEPRPENCVIFRLSMETLQNYGYDRVKGCRLICGDAEQLNRWIDRQFDVVYCYGLLYHVADPGMVIDAMAAHCADMLLMETVVAPGDDERTSQVEEISLASQAFYGRGSRPTRRWIHRALTDRFAHVYMPLTQPAHEEFPLDWSPSTVRSARNQRAIFVASRKPIRNPLLIEDIPMQQQRMT